MACVVFLLLVNNTVQGQQVRSYIPPSPNAASLGTYGQIPVSEYSGVPSIQIPLYSIEADGFSMPMSLSYHAAALRSSDEASWVGFGWSFNAGGVITRSKRHKDDFGLNGYFRTTGDRPCDEDTDQEPDMFYYNIGGKAGKFFIIGPFYNATVRYFTRDNIKIAYNASAQTFTLTSGEGAIYRFEKREYTNETTVKSDGSSESATYVSSWYVTSIELVNGTTITFSYLTPNNTKTVKELVSGDDDVATFFYPPKAAHVCCYPASDHLAPQYSRTTTTILTDEVILSQIDYPNGSVKLYATDRTDLDIASGTSPAKKLDHIEVYTGQPHSSTLLKTYLLNYDYYNGIPSPSDTRLRLRNVTEQTPSAAFKPYTFHYYSDNMRYGSAGATSFIGAAGLLKSIVYPTGGSSEFEFETVMSDQSIMAGARIKRMVAKDPVSSVDVKRFDYEGTRLMGNIRYGLTFSYSNTLTITCCDSGSTFFSYTRERRTYSDFSSLGETTNGHVFGHDKVITWYGEYGENGKKESFFENTAPDNPNYSRLINASPIVAYRYPVPVPLNTSNRCGLPFEEWEYRNNNGTFVPVRRAVNTYVSTDAVTTSARRFAFNSCEWAYDITTGWVQQTGQDVYTFDMNGANPVLASTQFFYDDPDNALPTRISTTDSKGQPVVTINTYVKDKSVQAGGVYATMLGKHIISTVIDQERTRNGLSVAKTYTSYKDWYGNGRVLKPEMVQQQKGAEAPGVAVQYKGYDENGNVLTLSREAGRPVSYIWGYSNTYPVAEVSNADWQPVNESVYHTYNTGVVLDVTPNYFPKTESFTTNTGQSYNFSIQLIAMGPGGFNGSINVQLMSSLGPELWSGSYTSANTFSASATLPPGTGSYFFVMSMPNPGTATTTIRVNVISEFRRYKVHNNIFHTSFEELTADFTADAKTGQKSRKGPFAVTMPWKTGDYILSWWQKPLGGGSWTYQEQAFNITITNTPDYVLGNNLLLLDEVRLYPRQARMTTYTYRPQVGMTTKCDERNQITRYEYDGLHRLKLIRDNNNNILKTFEYNYKN